MAQIIDSRDVPTEGQNTAEKEKRIAMLNSFRASDHYEFVMDVIEKAIQESAVKEMLSKKGASVDETELGKLTLLDWLSSEKIEKKIKNVLAR